MKTAEQHEGGRMALSELADGQWGVIESLELPADVQNQLMHMGFMPEAPVQPLRRAPAGDPTVYSIDGAEVALRRETAQWIQVLPLLESTPAEPSPAPLPGSTATDPFIEEAADDASGLPAESLGTAGKAS